MTIKLKIISALLFLLASTSSVMAQEPSPIPSLDVDAFIQNLILAGDSAEEIKQCLLGCKEDFIGLWEAFHLAEQLCCESAGGTYEPPESNFQTGGSCFAPDQNTWRECLATIPSLEKIRERARRELRDCVSGCWIPSTTDDAPRDPAVQAY